MSAESQKKKIERYSEEKWVNVHKASFGQLSQNNFTFIDKKSKLSS